MYSKVFWGVVIILFGISLIMNGVFKINFPFFKVLFAVIIIAFGFKLLFGSFSSQRKNHASGEHSSVFTSSNHRIEEVKTDMEFNTVFGSQKIDLRKARFENNEIYLEVNAVFGGIEVYLPDEVKVQIIAHSALGSVSIPDGSRVSLGEMKRTFIRGTDPKITIFLEANSVFAGIDLH